MKAIFKKGDIAFIKQYNDVEDHCGLTKTCWEDMYDKELKILQIRNTFKTYYRIEFESDLTKRIRTWYITEESLIGYNYYNQVLPDLCDMI